MAVSVVIETWIWYGAVCSMLILRLVSRFLLFKDVRKFQIEDWFMLFIFVLYTVLIVFLNICADVSTNLIQPQDIPTLTPEDIDDRIWGSKCVLVVESMMCAVQWGTKACLLMLYWRLTENLRQRLMVKLASGYCLITYIVMISLYYGYWCRPFSAFWQTPTSNVQCATQTHHLTVNIVFNLTSDLLVILIPLPMFIKAHLEPKKKLLLIFPFSLGFFTMVCAILSKRLSFTQPFSAEWIYWYTREASTAMIVTNMPYSWTIIRKLFRVKGFLNRSSSQSDPDGTSHGRHLSGISVPVSNATRQSEPKIATKRITSHISMFGMGKKGREKQSSVTDSVGPLNNEANAFNMVDWQKDDFPRKPSSSTSTEGPRDNRARQPIADVDRLYRLDDEDLEMELPRHHTARSYEP
ncbi:hypothetical protein LTS08_007554 [Lithohypha guttulata]|nr:hypothetical protein LTS08_007554 [Lithohypha guttulata]